MKLLAGLMLTVALCSCSVSKNVITEPDSEVRWRGRDFEFSPPVSASVTLKTFLGFPIGFKRQGTNPTSGLIIRDDAPTSIIPTVQIPFIGGGDQIASVLDNYAMYNLFQANPGYDLIFYPIFTRKIKSIIIYKKITATVQARMARFK